MFSRRRSLFDFSRGRLEKGVRRRKSRGKQRSVRLGVEHLEERQMLSVNLSGVPNWIAEGPGPTLDGQVRNIASFSPLGDDPVTGAVHTALADPGDADVLYIGATNGGLWRTTNATAGGGPNWTPLIDQFSSLSIGALQFDDADATNQTLLAGIGHFSSWSRIGGPLNGILKSTDGGDSWTQLGSADLTGRNISGLYARGNLIIVSANSFGGGTGSGVYQSMDGGDSFDLISGTNGLSTGAAFDLVVDPTNTSRLYVSIDDTGVFRSDNDGTDWVNVSQNDPAGLEAAIQASGNNNTEMTVSPTSGRIFVDAIQSGRSNYLGYSDDQGATWTQMDLPVSLEGAVGVTSVTGLGTTPIVITSAGHGLNNGQNVRVTGVTGNTAANAEFTVTLVDPDAGGPLTMNDGFQLDGSTPNGNYGGGGVWQLLVGLNPREKPGGQGGVHASITIDPNNDDIIYIGGDRQDAAPNAIGAVDSTGRLFRGDVSVAPVAPGDPTNEFSPQWEHLTDNQNAGFAGGGTANQSGPHADSREIVFDANGDLIEANDGGIYRRTNPTDNTGDWFSLIGDLQVAEFHDIAYDPVADIILGGAQDTGTPEQTSTGSLVWDSVSTADGGDVAVDALIGGGQSIRYTNTQNLGTFRRRIFDSTNTQVGATQTPSQTILGGGNPIGVQFVTPVVTNNVAPNRLIIGGSNSTYESLDQGDNLTEIGVGIGVNAAGSGDRDGSPVDYGGMLNGFANPEVLYVGSGNQVFLRSVAGAGNLNPTASLGTANNIQALKMHPDDWMTTYATDGSSVFQTTDGGSSWDNITGDLIDTMLRSIAVVTNGVLDAILVAGSSGVHRMLSGAPGMWSEFGSSLPNAPVSEIVYDAGDDVLVAGTLGRGAWSIQNATAAVFDKGVLEINGDMDFAGQDDVIDLVRDANNPNLLRVTVNGAEQPGSPFQLDTIQQINVNGLGGNDTLIVDSTNGLITIDMGIRYDGGLGDDQLTLEQTTDEGDQQDSETIMVGATVGSGIDTIVGPGGTQQVFFERLEPINTNVPAVTLTVNGAFIGSLLNGANQITYDESDVFGNTWGRITIDAFEPIHFTNKTDLIMDSENGDDTIALDNGSLPTGLETIFVEGDDGRDRVDILALPNADLTTFESVTVSAGPGNDVVDAGTLAVLTPLILNGNEGNDLLFGGPDDDTLDGGDDNDVLIPNGGDNNVAGGGGIDTLVIRGLETDDIIDVRQDSPNLLVTTVNGDIRADTFFSLENIRVELLAGDDVVRVTHDDSLVAAPASSLPVEVLGGPPNASDTLVVNDDGLGDLVIHRIGADQRSGTVSVGPLAPVTYFAIESVHVLPINAVTGGTGTDGEGRLVVFKNDPFESNNTLPNATFLGAGPIVNVDPTIDPGGGPFGIPGDNDFYQFVAQDTGTLDLQLYFEVIGTLANGRAGLPSDGELVVTVLDSDGVPVSIATATDLLDPNGIKIGERVTVPVVRNNTYYMRVEGQAGGAGVTGINVYNFTAITTAAPIPELVDLQATSDSGRNDTDDITKITTPTFNIILDDDRIDEFMNFNLDPDSVNDDLPTVNFDYGVEVFNNAVSIGFAFYTGIGNTWQFTATVGDLNEGDFNHISAAVWIRDAANPAQIGRHDLSPSLQVTLDTVTPPVSFGLPDAASQIDGLAAESDSGVTTDPATFADRVTSDTTPRLWGRAEANTIIRVYHDRDADGVVDLLTDDFLGQTVATPIDGNDAYPEGFWEITSVLDLNQIFGIPKDGVRRLLVTAEDVAGNPMPMADQIADGIDALNIFIDTQGPQVYDPAGATQAVHPSVDATYDLFDPKPSENGFSPLIDRITINVRDLPLRSNVDPNFLYEALQEEIAETVGNYSLVGDHVGTIGIVDVNVINAAAVNGQQATATIELVFADYLPDDRFTLTVSENLVDRANNNFDGESNANGPLDDPTFPSGDGVPGGDFVARFTVDSRPEIGSFVAQNIDIDINGNFVWDPANAQIGNDATNVDLTFRMNVADPVTGAIIAGGYGVHDLVFAGKFTNGNALASGLLFDQLAVFGWETDLDGQPLGKRWLVDTNSDGVINTADGDLFSVQPLLATFDVGASIPIAGNFDGNAANGDEIGLYNAGQWALDSNRNFVIDAGDTFINGNLLGHPIVGDFDGNGEDDLSVFNNNTFHFDMNVAGFDGFADDTIVWGFPGVLDRPVTADFDQDGIDDIGLWVPRDSAQDNRPSAEWYFLLSGDPTPAQLAAGSGTVNLIDHPFTPVPFGNDLYAEFGDELALPIVGNFDPPVIATDPTNQDVEETGDFDQDGDVDGSDFLALQRGYGMSGQPSMSDGDGNTDGVVDQYDLELWSNAYQASVAATSDFNDDSSVDGSDLELWSANFGTVTTVGALGDANQDGRVSGADFLRWQRSNQSLAATSTAALSAIATSPPPVLAATSEVATTESATSDAFELLALSGIFSESLTPATIEAAFDELDEEVAVEFVGDSEQLSAFTSGALLSASADGSTVTSDAAQQDSDARENDVWDQAFSEDDLLLSGLL